MKLTNEQIALCARAGLAPPQPGKKLRPAAVAKAFRKMASDGLRIHLKREMQAAGLLEPQH
jgi:hypothetical protein